MHLKRSVKVSILTLFIPLLLTGCFGISQPTESTINEAIQSYFDKQFADLFTATTIVKNSGYKDGDGHYVAEVTITANAQRSLEAFATLLMEDQNISPFERIQQGMSIGLLKITLPNFKAGEKIELKRHYLFIKSDNGWRLNKEITQD